MGGGGVNSRAATEKTGFQPRRPAGSVKPVNIAVIGDIHLMWDSTDIEFFNQSDYDHVLFVGDLPARDPGKVNDIAARLAEVNKSSFYMFGNHDAVTIPQLAAEVMQQQWLISMGAMGMKGRVKKLVSHLGNVKVCGYNSYALSDEVALVNMRPFAMGGFLSFHPYMKEAYGVATLADSEIKLRDLVDSVEQPKIVFMGHNGPHGLGKKPSDIWGVDFNRKGGDWGDTDYAFAIDYAKSCGKEVLVAVAGHMHHPTKYGKKKKAWHVEKEGVQYINAARYPRHERRGGVKYRHHVRIELTEKGAHVFRAEVDDAKHLNLSDDHAPF